MEFIPVAVFTLLPAPLPGGRDRKDAGPASPRDHAGERAEPQPVRPGVPDSLDLAAQHRVLVAKDG